MQKPMPSDEARPAASRDDLAWAFAKPDPAEVVARMNEEAKRALAATTSPPGYETAPEPERDR